MTTYVTTNRSRLLDCILHMTEIKVEVSGEEYTILKVDDNFKFSKHVSVTFPDFILIRECILDIRMLIHAKIKDNIRTFLITGTVGVGKCVSIIAWLYVALKKELDLTFKYIIVDMPYGCDFLYYNDDKRIWEGCVYNRDYFLTHKIENTEEVLYIHNATDRICPMYFPYCNVVFSPPNTWSCKDYLKINYDLRVIYFMPVWKWMEVEALYRVSTELQKWTTGNIEDIKKLFNEYGGVPRHILFAPYDMGHESLISTIAYCSRNIKNYRAQEEATFFTYRHENDDPCDKIDVVMHMAVVEDGAYEHAIVDYGSEFIRDSLREAEAARKCNPWNISK